MGVRVTSARQASKSRQESNEHANALQMKWREQPGTHEHSARQHQSHYNPDDFESLQQWPARGRSCTERRRREEIFEIEPHSFMVNRLSSQPTARLRRARDDNALVQAILESRRG